MICLKTLRGIEPMRFGYLIEPDCEMHSDEELYRAVQAHGKAVVEEHGVASHIEYTPETFEAEWRGD